MKRAVDELVWHHEIGWLVLFLQRANGRDRDNSLDAEFLERINVGAKVQLGRQNAVPASMPRQKGNLRPSNSPRTNASDGSPNGVSTRCSRTSVNPGIE